jgi:hypothetical protein
MPPKPVFAAPCGTAVPEVAGDPAVEDPDVVVDPDTDDPDTEAPPAAAAL